MIILLVCLGSSFRDMPTLMNSQIRSLNIESLTGLAQGLLVSVKAAKIATWILIFLIVYLLSTFSWSVWEYFQPRQTISVNQSIKNSDQSATINIRQLTGFNLFGDAQSKSTAVNNNQYDAPVTRLKLKLRGVYAASDDQLAGAMIEAQNKQDVYRIGANLPGATGLKLHKIMSDRVIMSRGGKFETLLIEDFGKASGSSRRNSTQSSPVPVNNNTFTTNDNSNIVDKRKDIKLTTEIMDLRSKLTDPKSLSELVSVSPAMNGDEFQGFRISPGKNRALFGRLGLRRNDVVTGVNGIKLDDPATAFSLMEQISTADEINLTIKRGSRDMNILFSAQTQ